MFIVCKHNSDVPDHAEENECLSNVCCVVSEKVYAVVFLVMKRTVVPICVCIKHNIRLTHRGCTRFINEVQFNREKPGTIVKSSGVASAYVKKILEQKKIIQQKSNKVFHSKNL